MDCPASDPLASTSAVVVNWNLPELTIRCVEALVEDGLSASRVVIVENGSDRASTAQLEEALPQCRVLRLEDNVGYARAANAGAQELSGDTYVFVNNDAFVHRPGSVGRLAASVGRADVGIAVPRLLNEDLTLQPNVVPLSSPTNAFMRAIGLSRFIPNRWQPRWSTHWDHAGSRYIDAAAGTVMAVDAKLWRRLAGWVERELMFSEDIDLCWRARNLGSRVWFEGEAEFVHLGNASGRHWTEARRAELVARSEASTIQAELGGVRAALTIRMLSLGLIARLAYFSATRDRVSADWTRATLRGYRQQASEK